METSFTLELGGPVGGALTPYHSLSFSPKREETTFLLQQEDIFLLYYSSRKKGGSSPCPTTTQSMIDCYKSANEKPLHFEFPVFSNGLFVYNSPSEPSPLFSIKEHFSSSVSWLACSSTLNCMSRIAILRCSWINLFC